MKQSSQKIRRDVFIDIFLSWNSYASIFFNNESMKLNKKKFKLQKIYLRKWNVFVLKIPAANRLPFIFFLRFTFAEVMPSVYKFTEYNFFSFCQIFDLYQESVKNSRLKMSRRRNFSSLKFFLSDRISSEGSFYRT